MTDLDQGLEDWLKQVEKFSHISIDDRAKITEAGAQVYAKKLREATPVSEVNYGSHRAGHGRKSKHLRDSITYKPGYTSDKLKSGDTTVGYEEGYASMVARFVNDGTSRMSAKQVKNMHFKERVDVEAKNAVLEAVARKYKELKGL